MNPSASNGPQSACCLSRRYIRDNLEPEKHRISDAWKRCFTAGQTGTSIAESGHHAIKQFIKIDASLATMFKGLQQYENAITDDERTDFDKAFVQSRHCTGDINPRSRLDAKERIGICSPVTRGKALSPSTRTTWYAMKWISFRNITSPPHWMVLTDKLSTYGAAERRTHPSPTLCAQLFSCRHRIHRTICHSCALVTHVCNNGCPAAIYSACCIRRTCRCSISS